MLVYIVIFADILAGNAEHQGLICDWAGKNGGDWCDSRIFWAGVVTLFFICPLCSVKSLGSAALASWLGVFANGIWAVATLLLLGVAISKGQAKGVPALPDWSAFGKSGWQIFTQISAIIPVIATAFTCQMSVHYVVRMQTLNPEPGSLTLSLGYCEYISKAM